MLNPSFAFKMKLRANEQYFRKFRCALGTMRQNPPRKMSAADNAAILRMQDLCGDIEMSLYSAQNILSRR